MPYFAEVVNGIVQRVIVAESAEWCVETLGGTWIETLDGDATEQYAGPGMVYDPGDPAKFVRP